MEVTEIKYFVEAAMLAAGRPLSIDQLQNLFDENSMPEKTQIREAIKALQEEFEPRGIEVSEVASGFRMQIKTSMADRLERLWEERPPRYSRALFETLALIAYRQPLTRGEIEEVRGVSVSSNIIRSLMEREWIRVVGHRDVPGRPAMFGTTRVFLDYFGLKKLDDLPPLADLSDWESLRVQLNLPEVEDDQALDADDIAIDGPLEGVEEDDEGAHGAVVTPLPVAARDAAVSDFDNDQVDSETGDIAGAEDARAGDTITSEDDEPVELPESADTSASNA